MKKALERMKTGTAMVLDNIPIEVWKCLVEIGWVG